VKKYILLLLCLFIGSQIKVYGKRKSAIKYTLDSIVSNGDFKDSFQQIWLKIDLLEVHTGKEKVDSMIFNTMMESELSYLNLKQFYYRKNADLRKLFFEIAVNYKYELFSIVQRGNLLSIDYSCEGKVAYTSWWHTFFYSI